MWQLLKLSTPHLRMPESKYKKSCAHSSDCWPPFSICWLGNRNHREKDYLHEYVKTISEPAITIRLGTESTVYDWKTKPWETHRSTTVRHFQFKECKRYYFEFGDIQERQNHPSVLKSRDFELLLRVILGKNGGNWRSYTFITRSFQSNTPEKMKKRLLHHCRNCFIQNLP